MSSDVPVSQLNSIQTEAEQSGNVSHSFAVSSFYSLRKEENLVSFRRLSVPGLVESNSESALSADTTEHPCVAGLHPSPQHCFLSVLQHLPF